MSAFEHVNRLGVRYFLHRREDRRGRERFVFAREFGNGALDAVPTGYVVRESANGVVSVVRDEPRRILEAEEALVVAALAPQPGGPYPVEVRGAAIVVHQRAGGFGGRVEAVLRFELVDRDARTFEVRRMTWRGEGGWSHPLGHGALAVLVRGIVKHLGRDSFFDLM